MVMELRNQNGKIVGIDADGNEVPVEFGSLSTGEESIKDPSDSTFKQDVRTVEETETNVDAQYRQFGDFPRGLLPTEGARTPPKQLFYERDPITWSSHDTVLERFRIPPFFHNPGTIPAIWFTARIKNSTAGEDAGLKASLRDEDGNFARGTPLEMRASYTDTNGDTFTRIDKVQYVADGISNNSTSVKKSFPVIELRSLLSAGEGEARHTGMFLMDEVR